VRTQRDAEFSELQGAAIRVCSWNVGAQPRPPHDLRDWVLGGGEGDGPPDVVAVGLQEVVTLSTSALFQNESSAESRLWEDALGALVAAADMKVLIARQYVGIFLFLAARRALVEQGAVRDVECKAAACGIMGQLGNKGAVSARLMVFSSAVCFVCSHLAAGQAQVERRNQDHLDILRRTVFGTSAVDKKLRKGTAATASFPDESDHPAQPASGGGGGGSTTVVAAAPAHYSGSFAGASVDSADLVFWSLPPPPDLPRALLPTSLAPPPAPSLHAWNQRAAAARGFRTAVPRRARRRRGLTWCAGWGRGGRRFGDLNYRVELPRDHAVALIRRKSPRPSNSLLGCVAAFMAISSFGRSVIRCLSPRSMSPQPPMSSALCCRLTRARGGQGRGAQAAVRFGPALGTAQDGERLSRCAQSVGRKHPFNDMLGASNPRPGSMRGRFPSQVAPAARRDVCGARAIRVQGDAAGLRADVQVRGGCKRGRPWSHF